MSDDTLTTAYEQGWADANEAAAKACEQLVGDHLPHECAAEVRTLTSATGPKLPPKWTSLKETCRRSALHYYVKPSHTCGYEKEWVIGQNEDAVAVNDDVVELSEHLEALLATTLDSALSHERAASRERLRDATKLERERDLFAEGLLKIFRAMHVFSEDVSLTGADLLNAVDGAAVTIRALVTARQEAETDRDDEDEGDEQREGGRLTTGDREALADLRVQRATDDRDAAFRARDDAKRALEIARLDLSDERAGQRFTLQYGHAIERAHDQGYEEAIWKAADVCRSACDDPRSVCAQRVLALLPSASRKDQGGPHV